MFGKSTASRFNVQKKTETPGPGEYDVKELKTTKRGGISKMERKFEYQKGSEFTHLGPGTYVTPSTLIESAKGVASWVAPAEAGAVHDSATAMKKLTALWQKLYGSDTTKASIKDRDDVVSFLARMVADGSTANAESISLSEEFASVRIRLAEEVALGLKPGRGGASSSGNTTTCNLAAWKKVEPLSKAADQAGASTRKKMDKVSSLLAGLSEVLPSMVQVLSEPERERELKQAAEDALAEAKAAGEALSAAQEELEGERERLRMAQERYLTVQTLVSEGSKRIADLETRMASSSEDQGQLIEALMNLARAPPLPEEDRLEELEVLTAQLMEARRSEGEAMDELEAVRAAHFAQAFGDEERLLAREGEVEEARLASEGYIAEVVYYGELLGESRKEARRLRLELSSERAAARRLRRTVAFADGMLQTGEGENAEVDVVVQGGGGVMAVGEGEGEAGVVEVLSLEVRLVAASITTNPVSVSHAPHACNFCALRPHDLHRRSPACSPSLPSRSSLSPC